MLPSQLHPVSVPSPPPPLLCAQSVWQQTFQIAGFRFDIRAADETAFHAINTFASGHHLIPLSAATAINDGGNIVFHRHQSAPALPFADASLDLAHGTASVCGQTIYVNIADATLIISPSPAETLHVYLPEKISNELIGILFIHALHAALRRCGWFELHAACLVAPAQRTNVLFIGDSGCGKSTLTVRLVEQGWFYLTDDSVLLNEKLRAIPMRRYFALTGQTRAACNLTASALAKSAFDPAPHFPAAALTEAHPHHLVFPTLTHEASSELAPLTQATAMMRLLRQSPWACFDPLTGKQHIALLTQLVHRTQAWELSAGRDLLEIPDCADKLMSQLA